MSWRDWRNWLLMDPRFQRGLNHVPGLRRFARGPATTMFDLCTGFIRSQVLYLSVATGLLRVLRDGALPDESLRDRCHLSMAGARALLAATDALGLTEPRAHDSHGLATIGAALLGNEAVLTMIAHQPAFYRDLADAVGLVRQSSSGGELKQHWSYVDCRAPARLSAGDVGDYTALMGATQSLVSDEVLGAYPFDRHECALDVGGGNGTFLAALATKVPQLRLMLLDLPAVAEIARSRLKTLGLSERAQIVGGDFLAQAIPSGADLITLVRVVHDHPDAAVSRLLRSVYEALPPRGRVVIAEPMRGLPGTVRASETYLDFYLLAMRQGSLRSRAELAAMLCETGFSDVQLHRTARPWQCGVISAAHP